MNKKRSLVLIAVMSLFLAACESAEDRYGEDGRKDFTRLNGSLTFTYRNYDGTVLANKSFFFREKEYFGEIYEGIPFRESTQDKFYSFDGWTIVSDVITELKNVYNRYEIEKVFKKEGEEDRYDRHKYRVANIDVYAHYAEYDLDDLFTYVRGEDDVYGIMAKSSFDLMEFTVPSSYNGGTVKSLLPKSFSNLSRLEKITIPNSVDVIGDSSFENDESLRQVTLGNLTDHIGTKAFYGCSSLETIDLPATISTLSSKAFASSGLKNVDLSGLSIGSLSSSLFEGCKDLAQVTLNSSLEKIEAAAFGSCSALTSITIPENVKDLGENAFRACSALKKVELKSNSTQIRSNCFINASTEEFIIKKGSNVSIEANAFEGNKSLTKIETENAAILTLSGNAFKNCTALKSIILPSATVIGGKGVFAGCSKDLNVYFEGSTLSGFPNGYNDGFEGTFYVYSENEPTGFGNFWHYVNGAPVAW